MSRYINLISQQTGVNTLLPVCLLYIELLKVLYWLPKTRKSQFAACVRSVIEDIE